ncbi:MAG TPA: YceH family protein [Acidimicrobiia bacterium]|jgi:uncharacterized protein YceH (UPF0502 family)|nr:YceH family protein [Acidimicrobiia bacterium]
MTEDLSPTLTPVEARILGVLVEKEKTTPDYYPLTLSAVVAGCNQATNRDPVMDLDESEVERALVSLHDAQLATPVRRSGDRATKYRHKLAETLEIDDRQQAVLAVLLLRGPQTSGELRTRTERYVQFGSVEEVEEVVDRLAEASLVERMPRSPGQSQRRIRQLLAEEGAPDPAPVESASPSDLEARVSELEARFARLLESLGVDDI